MIQASAPQESSATVLVVAAGVLISLVLVLAVAVVLVGDLSNSQCFAPGMGIDVEGRVLHVTTVDSFGRATFAVEGSDSGPVFVQLEVYDTLVVVVIDMGVAVVESADDVGDVGRCSADCNEDGCSFVVGAGCCCTDDDAVHFGDSSVG